MTFGKIDPADLALTRCPFDTSAGAMVLSDVGQTRFEYDTQLGFYMVFERWVRIKIFNRTGYDMADWEIPLFHIDEREEMIDALKGRTYNLEGGKVVESKVTSESMFTEDEDRYWKNRRFTFPAVKEGSVLELKYSIKSRFFSNLRDWDFQWNIPVRWSEYTVIIPEFFSYSRQIFGSVKFAVNEQTSRPDAINMVQGTYNSINFTDYILHIAGRDIPSMKPEPFSTTVRNYSSRVEFVLHSYHFPDRALVPVNNNWEQIITDLMRDEDFGQQIDKSGVAGELAARVRVHANNPVEKMQEAYNLVKGMMKWNGIFSKWPTGSLRKALQEKSGNSADINLLLIALLKELGLNAAPVLLSTRSHGTIAECCPAAFRLNDVICLVTINGKEYLLDATHPLRPPGMLPFECLNGKGITPSGDKVRWLNLRTEERDATVFQGDFLLEPSGEITGTLVMAVSGYGALSGRNELAKNGIERETERLKESLPEWDVDKVTIEHADSLSEPLVTSFALHSSTVTGASVDMIHFPALANVGTNYNPLIMEKRETPVDFGCPQKETWVLTFRLPDGYAAESVPENITIALPGDAGSFRFTAEVRGKTITVNGKLSIMKPVFMQGEYENLRTFLTQVIARQSSQIVLKKS